MSEIDDDARACLEAFFRRRSPDPDTLKVADYQPITGGYSRSMARVWVEDSSGRKGYITRADPPRGQSIIETDRAAEWALLSALAKSGAIPIPAPLWFDPGDELGTPTIVTEMVDGQSLLALAVQRDRSEHLTMAEGLCELAATIHAFDIEQLPDHLEVPGSWDDYLDARIQEWVDAEDAHVDSDPFMRLIASWLKVNKPPPAPLSLVHGDFNPNNVMVDSDGTYLMVDWELAHVGDPREDLGWLALLGVNQPPDLIAEDPEAFYARYRDLTGLSEQTLNPAIIAYFTVLGAAAIFMPVVVQLASLARDETTSVNVAYVSTAVAGMHNVFMNAMATHDRLTGGLE
jgi:aminoglycoside phosphotransferase (APT) family kinase protein